MKKKVGRPPGYKHTAEHKAFLSAKMRGTNAYWFGKKHSLETKEKLRKHNTGKKHSEYTKMKMSMSRMGRKGGMLGKKHSAHTRLLMSSQRVGENNWRWIKDRSKVSHDSSQGERRSHRYKDWRMGVFRRDSWQCQLKSGECHGRIEAHHIYSFTEFPRKKYLIDNGITLCHFHHPRKKSEEIALRGTLQSIIGTKYVG
jgi:hypothetical protein